MTDAAENCWIALDLRSLQFKHFKKKTIYLVGKCFRELSFLFT